MLLEKIAKLSLMLIFISVGMSFGQTINPNDEDFFSGGPYENRVANVLQHNENRGISVLQMLIPGEPCVDMFLAEFILQARSMDAARWTDVMKLSGLFGGLDQDGLQSRRVVEFRDPRPGNSGKFPVKEWYRVKFRPLTKGDGNCTGYLRDLEHYEVSYLIPDGVIFKSFVGEQIPGAAPGDGEIAKGGYSIFNLAGPRKMRFVEWKEADRVGKIVGRSFNYDPKTPRTPMSLPIDPRLNGRRSVYVLDLERGISTNTELLE